MSTQRSRPSYRHTVRSPRSAIHTYQPSRRTRPRAVVVIAVVSAVVLIAGGWMVFGRRPEAPAPKPRALAQPAGVLSYLGGAARDAAGEGPPPQNLDLVWKLDIGSGKTRRKSDEKPVIWSGTGWTGQPTVVTQEGTDWLLLGGYDHNLHRIEAATGRVEWESTWDDVIKGTNTVVGNPAPSGEATRVIVVSGARRGSKYRVGDDRIAPLRAVSFATGEELWRLPVPKTHNYSQDVDSSPLWYRNALYAPVESGYLYKLDPFRTTGSGSARRPIILARSPRLYEDDDVKAHPDTGGANLAVESSPSAIGDTIYITAGSGHIYGLDAKTLAITWDFETGSDIDGTPVVTSDKLLLVTIEKQYIAEKGGLFLLDPAKPPAESVRWYLPTPTRGFGEWGGGSVGSAGTNEASNDGSRPRLAAFTSVDGAVRVVSLDVLSGRTTRAPGVSGTVPVPLEVFSDSIGGSISTPVLVGDTMVVAGYGRRVNLYRFTYSPASKGDEDALPSPDGRYWTMSVKRIDSFKGGSAFESTPLVWGGRVYIGCRDGYLYCLGR